MNTGNTQSKRDDEIEPKESSKQYPYGDKKEYRQSMIYFWTAFLIAFVFLSFLIYVISLI